MALASYERTVLSGDSPFDRYLYKDDKTALSEEAQRGLKIFVDKKRGNCSTCHTIGETYALFSDGKFHNIGAGINANGEMTDLGRYDQTKVEADKGAFRTPSLRNIALTAPYMHDGSLKTLKDVVDFYAGGGTSNPSVGSGDQGIEIVGAGEGGSGCVFRVADGEASHMTRMLLVGLLLVLAACSKPKPAPVASAAPDYFKVDSGTAGVISGKIEFTGKAVPAKTIDMSEIAECAKQHPKAVIEKPVAVNKNGTLANVFVYIKGGLEGKKFEPPTTPAVMDQKGCWFEPRVLGIAKRVNNLKVTNSDPVTHNIHPRAHMNREWNQSREAEGTPPLQRKFSQQEIMIRVKCNIHSWMHAFIGVVDNPYFAVTGPEGTFELKNVPPGDYIIEAWQEELGSAVQHVTVTPSGKTEVAFIFKGE